jgi:hypothetical protein
MSQHDFNIANQGFPGFRSDLNNALVALATLSSGATAPTATFAYQHWVDTSTSPPTLKIRNGTNDGWISVTLLNSSTNVSTPVIITQSTSDNSTNPASTAYVINRIANDAPTKTGTGASGTWGINITGNASGNAATATTAASATNIAFATKEAGLDEQAQFVVKKNGFSDAIFYSNAFFWGMYSVAGGDAFYYERVNDRFIFKGIADTVANAAITGAKLSGAQTGTAPVYGARAWVSFNGTGTIAIRGSGNVSSLIDNGTGDYRINVTTTLVDTDYCAIATAKVENNNTIGSNNNTTIAGTFISSATQIGVVTSSTSSVIVDSAIINVAVFR